MVKFSLLLSYRGLPKSWETGPTELATATQMKLDKAGKVIKETQKGGVIFIHGNPAIILNLLWEPDTINKFIGISFPKYFSSKMDKDIKAMELNPSRYTFIYDIGNEAAINKQFSGQLLKQLITDCKNEEVWCFVCSDIPKATFCTQYGIDIKNNITLPKEVELKLI